MLSSCLNSGACYSTGLTSILGGVDAKQGGIRVSLLSTVWTKLTHAGADSEQAS